MSFLKDQRRLRHQIIKIWPVTIVGQTETSARERNMSGLHPLAIKLRTSREVCFVPIASFAAMQDVRLEVPHALNELLSPLNFAVSMEQPVYADLEGVNGYVGSAPLSRARKEVLIGEIEV